MFYFLIRIIFQIDHVEEPKCDDEHDREYEATYWEENVPFHVFEFFLLEGKKMKKTRYFYKID